MPAKQTWKSNEDSSCGKNFRLVQNRNTTSCRHHMGSNNSSSSPLLWERLRKNLSCMQKTSLTVNKRQIVAGQHTGLTARLLSFSDIYFLKNRSSLKHPGRHLCRYHPCLPCWSCSIIPALQAQNYKQQMLENLMPELHFQFSQCNMLRENWALPTAHSSQAGSFLLSISSAISWHLFSTENLKRIWLVASN